MFYFSLIFLLFWKTNRYYSVLIKRKKKLTFFYIKQCFSGLYFESYFLIIKILTSADIICVFNCIQRIKSNLSFFITLSIFKQYKIDIVSQELYSFLKPNKLLTYCYISTLWRMCLFAGFPVIGEPSNGGFCDMKNIPDGCSVEYLCPLGVLCQKETKKVQKGTQNHNLLS